MSRRISLREAGIALPLDEALAFAPGSVKRERLHRREVGRGCFRLLAFVAAVMLARAAVVPPAAYVMTVDLPAGYAARYANLSDTHAVATAAMLAAAFAAGAVVALARPALGVSVAAATLATAAVATLGRDPRLDLDACLLAASACVVAAALYRATAGALK